MVIKVSNYNIEIGGYRTELKVKLIPAGEDLVIVIGGGNQHIGSVAVALPRPGKNNENNSSTTSVFNLTGHKDDYLSRPLAAKIAAKTGRVVTVVSGFHLDNISKEEIKKIFYNLKIVEKKILEYLSPEKKNDKEL